VKPERKRELGRPRHRWQSTVEMYVKETGRENVNWKSFDSE
jgi:hypothetical protein